MSKEKSADVERFDVAGKNEFGGHTITLKNGEPVLFNGEMVSAVEHDRIVAKLREELARLDVQGGNACCHGYAPHTPADWEAAQAEIAALEGKIEHTEQRLGIAMSLLAQCDNRMFLVGNCELRRAAGGWKLFRPPCGMLVGNDLKALQFESLIGAAVMAMQLSEEKAAVMPECAP